MAMKPEFLEVLAGAGAAAITHIGLVDGDGVELAGGDPAYARQAVSWEEDELENGILKPESDLTAIKRMGLSMKSRATSYYRQA